MILTAVFFIAFTTIFVFGFIIPIIKQTKITSDLWNTKNAFFMGESGASDVVYRIKSGVENFNSGGELFPVYLGEGNSVLTTITDILGGKTIITTSNIDGYVRKTQVTVKKGEGVSFSYGIQTGIGGFEMNGGKVIGNVYSNGDITACSTCSISGSAISANRSEEFADQKNETPSSPSSYLTFGTATNVQDIAQSFEISTTTVINSAEIYIKKIGSPSNATLKIVEDSNGKPGKNDNDVLAMGDISVTLVSTNPNWLRVPFSSNPTLFSSTTYWLVIDSSVSSSNYYSVGVNLDNSYSLGTSMRGDLTSSNSWSNTGYDYYFRIYLGGSYGKITGTNVNNQLDVGTDGIGDAYAHIVNNVDVAGNLKCQVGTGNNKACNTSFPDPVQTPYPISDANINNWKDEALAGGVIDGDFDSGGYREDWLLGPKKISGDLLIKGSAVVTITGTVWVTGNIIMEGNSKLKLSLSFGANSGVLVADGRIDIPGSCSASSSGISGSYILLISNSTYNGPTYYAMNISGTGGAVVLNAQKGTINFTGSGSANEVTAKKILINGNNTITYEDGLINPSFVSGPSGSFNITGWKELEN